MTLRDSKDTRVSLDTQEVSWAERPSDDSDSVRTKVYTPGGIEIHEDDLDDEEPYIDLDIESSVLEAREKSTKFKVFSFLWDAYDKHPLEKLFLIKLDFFLMSSVMLGYFIKNLNQSNINTAYVNGMLEHYDMTDNQLNYMKTLFTVGYIIGQIPSNLILHRVSVRYYIGGLEIIWGILTALMATCKTVNGVYAIRFFLGLLESGYFPAIEYVLGSWYSRRELSKRSTFFACAGTAAGMVSGPLQQALLSGFSHSKLEPFKWLFIFDAIISFPIGFYTILVDPNTPSTTNAWYFSMKDKLIALERRRRIGAQLKTRERYTLKKIKSFFNTWHIWVFPLIFLAYNNSCEAKDQPTFTTWMKYDLNLSDYKYNIYPTIVSGVSIGSSIIAAFLADYFNGQNPPFVLSYFVIVLFACICLAVWHIPIGLHWFSYFALAFPRYGQPQIFSWINRLILEDDMKRNFVVVFTNTIAYVTDAWIPILTWNTKDQPRYFIGFSYTAVLCVFGVFWTIVGWYLTIRDERKKSFTLK